MGNASSAVHNKYCIATEILVALLRVAKRPLSNNQHDYMPHLRLITDDDLIKALTLSEESSDSS